MKTLPLLYFITLSFLSVAPSITLAQTNCTHHTGEVISCTGPSGYQLEAREGINGQTSYYDNRGNVGTVNQHPNGGVSVTPTQVGRRAPSVAFPPLSSMDAASHSRALRPLPGQQESPQAPHSAAYSSYPYHVLDKSKLPQTEEEYRLSMLWMKAVREKDFEKAEEWGQLLRMEKFAKATIAERVQMFEEALSIDRQEVISSLDRVEQRIRSEMGANRVADFSRFKQKVLMSQKEQQQQLQKEFQKQVSKWKLEEEVRVRFAQLETDLAALRKLELDAVELEKREAGLIKRWSEAEDEQNKKLLAILDAELQQMIVEDVESGRKTISEAK